MESAYDTYDLEDTGCVDGRNVLANCYELAGMKQIAKTVRKMKDQNLFAWSRALELLAIKKRRLDVLEQMYCWGLATENTESDNCCKDLNLREYEEFCCKCGKKLGD